MRETELDGDWGRWTAGRLQPAAGLRRRFDALLSAQGEVAIDALRPWIAAQVAAAYGAAGAAQVLELWDRYLLVQSAAYTLEARPGDPATWQPALAEHSRVRRRLLGAAWAEAFYGDEEHELAADAGRRQAVPSGGVAATGSADALLGSAYTTDAELSGLQAARTAQFGPEAADRLGANDAAWRLWQQRIDAAQAASDAIANDPALSPIQRLEAEARLLDERFAPDERIRARGLITGPVTTAAPVGRQASPNP